jgi:hypothetical protein
MRIPDLNIKTTRVLKTELNCNLEMEDLEAIIIEWFKLTRDITVKSQDMDFNLGSQMPRVSIRTVSEKEEL